ncbi:glycoside hydrolase family 128 protein [Auriscalpium vulgare]|uniref:Glycoside hydrolase family 128 protein n=1 Tax=Auriscalpium vulgare TaxID=40419 RepID=A0ACB8S115_9AGAM|nr:glycoside hydrolase family 128 protein [Auriscalpium vulgare]
MAALKFFNLLALSSLALVALSFNAAPVNALATDHRHIARSINHAHNGVAKKKRDSKRCKPRTASSSLVSSSAPASSTAHSSTAAATTTTHTTTKSSSTAKAAATTASSGGSAGGNSFKGKVGLSWSNGEQGTLSHHVSDSVGMVYNWTPQKVAGADALGLAFLPQLWGEKDIGAFQQYVKKGYATHVLGFNEPDQSGQSNLSPSQGVSLWRTYIDPLKDQGYTLISPATTNAASGKQWLVDFIDQCTGCTVDAISTHFYGTKAQDLIDHLNDLHTTFNKPIYLTEYACQDYSGANNQCSQDEIFSFMGTTTSFMQSQSWMAGYFWFSSMTGSELQANKVNPLNALIQEGDTTQRTDLGNMYLNP